MESVIRLWTKQVAEMPRWLRKSCSEPSVESLATSGSKFGVEPALNAVARQLLTRTGASRVTIRHESGMHFPVVAEATLAGVRSIAADTTVDVRRQPVVRMLAEGEDMVIQRDSREAISDQSFHDMLRTYEVTAQIVAAVRAEERLVAIVSVHQSGGPRDWSAADIGAVSTAVAAVGNIVAERSDEGTADSVEQNSEGRGE